MTWLVIAAAAVVPAALVWWAVVGVLAERRRKRARLAMLRALRPQPGARTRRPVDVLFTHVQRR